MFADLNVSAAAEAADESKRLNSNRDYQAQTIQVDVSDRTSVQDMINKTVQLFGKIDYAVNSAGVGTIGRCLSD